VVTYPVLALWLAATGCQSESTSRTPPPVAAIEARDAANAVVARVVPGHPCRATVDGFELLVGGPELIAQVGADRWTGEDAENGTTLRKNDRIVARIHANQLFDENGIPLLRVMENGDIVDKANARVRTATVSGATVHIGDLTITGTTNVALAAFLTAREAEPSVRALAACRILFAK
jgi:hypothetical protein